MSYEQETEIFALLDKLKSKRREEFDEEFDDPFSISTPVALSPNWAIPTLEKGVYHPPSPMLTSRFKYAGTWVDAQPGKTWLSLKEMESSWDDAQILEQLEIREQYYENSILVQAPRSHLSLLGLDVDGNEESYLHWLPGVVEPRIISYYGGDIGKFDNFRDLLLWLTADS